MKELDDIIEKYRKQRMEELESAGSLECAIAGSFIFLLSVGSVCCGLLPGWALFPVVTAVVIMDLIFVFISDSLAEKKMKDLNIFRTEGRIINSFTDLTRKDTAVNDKWPVVDVTSCSGTEGDLGIRNFFFSVFLDGEYYVLKIRQETFEKIKVGTWFDAVMKKEKDSTEILYCDFSGREGKAKCR